MNKSKPVPAFLKDRPPLTLPKRNKSATGKPRKEFGRILTVTQLILAYAIMLSLFVLFCMAISQIVSVW